MNFKKILVLAMVLVMAIGAIAPAALALDREEVHNHHENVQATIEEVVAYVTENYEEAYEYGYAYALENGYLDVAVNAVNDAIAALEAAEVELPEDMKAAVEEELDACVETLNNVAALLTNTDVDNVEGLVIALLALETKYELHLGNVYAILLAAADQALVDEINATIENAKAQVINAVEELVDSVYNRVREYAIAKAQYYYEKAYELHNLTVETYNNIVETVVNMREAAIRSYVRLVAIAVDTYETTLEVLAKVEVAVETMIDVMINTADYLIETHKNSESAMRVVTKVYNKALRFALAHKSDVKAAAVEAKQLVNDVVDSVLDTYEETNSVYATVVYVINGVVKVVSAVNEALYNVLNGAVNGNYVLDADSHYVAIGNAEYASDLAEMLHLAGKYDHFELGADYGDALANADLVSLDFSNNDVFNYALMQVMGVIGETLSANQTFMSWYNHSNPMVSEAVREQLANYGIDVEAKTEALDWEQYLDARELRLLNSFLVRVKAHVLALGIPEVYVIPMGDYIASLPVFESVSSSLKIVCDVEVNAADLVVFAVENTLYKYVEYTNTIAETLALVNEVAPEALVVLTGYNNFFAEFEFDMQIMGVEVDDIAAMLGATVELLNLELYTIALNNENVIFVPEKDADQVFDALNFSCAHVYDNCEDTVCNLCEGEREALEHVYVDYTYNNDATCTKNGTETAKCENCDITTTREKTNSKTAHDWKAATCTAPKTCKDCGATEGKVADHTYGNWNVVEEPTTEKEGLQEKKCTVCGHAVTEPIPVLEPLPVEEEKGGVKVGLIILIVAILAGAGFGVYWYIKKRK